VTVDTAGSATATWTARFNRLRPSNKHNPVSLWEKLDNRKLWRNQGAEGMEHGQIDGVDCHSDSMNLFAPSVHPAVCTKYAEEPLLDAESHLD